MSKNVAKNIKDAYRRLGTLESQNKQLSAELHTAQQQIKELQDNQKAMLKHKGGLKAQPGKSSEAAFPQPVPTEDVEGKLENDSPAPATVSKYLVPTGPVDHPPALFQAKRNLSTLHFEKQAGQGSTNVATAASTVPLVAASAVPEFDAVPGLKLSPLKSPSTTSTQAPDGTMFGGDGSVRLELTSVKVQQKNIKLHVTFRNNGRDEIVIPGSTKAIVRIVGEPDQAVKVRFDKKAIAGGASVAGEINLPGTKLDPTADVFLPKIVSSASGPKDVHLTVPISALNTTAQQ